MKKSEIKKMTKEQALKDIEKEKIERVKNVTTNKNKI